MKKLLVSAFTMALMVSSSALNAQEAEAALEAQSVETIQATVVEASSPAGEVAPVVADAQESVSDGVVLEQIAPVPVASEVAYDSRVVLSGGQLVGEQPIQWFAQPSCCGQSSVVQPVVFNQDVVGQAVEATNSVVTPAPLPAAPVYSQPAASGCGSCSGGAVVNYAPEATSFSSAPMGSSYASAPVASSFVAAPVQSAGCSNCGGAVSYAPNYSSNACCQPSGRMQRRISSRLRGVLVGRLIRDNN